MKVYIAMKHPRHPYDRNNYLETGTVEKVFAEKKVADSFVSEKNKKATNSFWSVKTKLIEPSNAGVSGAAHKD